MKKIFTLVCAAIMSLSAVNAKLIFQESFDGKNGAVGQLNAGATGSYSNPNPDFTPDNIKFDSTRWWTYSGSGNYIQVAEGSLSYEGYQSTGLGNKAYLWSTGADDLRSFAHKPVKSGKAYLAAIINIATLKASATPDYFIHLGDHVNSYYNGLLYTKSVKEGDNWIGFKMGIAKTSQESANFLQYTEDIYEPNKDYLVVIEYEFVPGEKNDTVRLYVNPTKDTKEPTIVCKQDTVNGAGSQYGAKAKPDAGNSGVFGVFLRQGLNTPKVYVDEIKVATAWADLWQEGGGEQPIDDGTVDNIAELMASPVQHTYILKTQPIVTNIEGTGKDLCITVQDTSGAVIINDFPETRFLNNAKIGDKIDKLAAMPIESSKYINGLPTAQLKEPKSKVHPSIVSSGNSVIPFEVSLAEATKYGPAWIQLEEVEFTGTELKFAAEAYDIKQGEAVAKLKVPAGCDIIDEDIPAKADIKAMVVKGGESVEIQISASTDVTNREAKSGTGFESTQKSEIRSQKAIINGQLVIIRGDKMFNALGTEL